MEYKIDQTYKGTRIILGPLAEKKRTMIQTLSSMAQGFGFNEIFLPSIELTELYVGKAGSEVLNQMFTFMDKGDRHTCLRPEGTATCQELAKSIFKHKWDVKIFYVTECFRYEQPQAGRYRQFTQFGIEWLNPKNKEKAEGFIRLYALKMAKAILRDFTFQDSVKRGLSYYTEDGFEIEVDSLGAQKQVCGGGPYEEGVGCAFGIDRMIHI